MCFMLVLLIPIMSVAAAEERSFEIKKAQIDVVVDNAGNLHVTEMDIYEFNGEYNGIYIDLNSNHSNGIHGFQVFDVTAGARQELEYELNEDGDEQHYKVYSASHNETRAYQFSYVVDNAVKVYADTAELYWKFFDESNSSDIASVLINVRLPEGAQPEQVKMYGHGPDSGTVEYTEDGTVYYEVGPLSAGETVEARVLFPVEIVPDSVNRSQEMMLDNIIAEEQAWADADAASYESNGDDRADLGLALLLLNIVVGFIARMKYGKKHKSEWRDKYCSELPNDVTPAVVSFLRKHRLNAIDLYATLIDFVRKGYLRLEKKEKDDYAFILIKYEWSELDPHEQLLMNWLFHEQGRSGSLRLSELRGQSETEAKTFMSRFGEWKNAVKARVDELGYYEYHSKAFWAVLLLFFLQFFGIMFLASENVNWIAFCALPLLFLRPKRRRRSRYGETEYKKWQAFRRYLQQYNTLDVREPLSVYEWQHYFVYAIPLGVAKGVAEMMKSLLPIDQRANLQDDYFYMYEYTNGSHSFNSAFNKIAATANPSDDSGGSFSSGGGGGGGGGGRGAF